MTNPPILTPQVAPRVRPSLLLRSVTLMKPVTWFAPAWALLCGTVASNAGNWNLNDFGRALLGMLLAGPVVCGLSQVINDWADRDVDAINEPQRLIPSGQVSMRQVYLTIVVLVAAALLIAGFLGNAILLLTAIGMLLAAAYSIQPIRAKRNGWIGSLVVAVSYEGLPWLAGHLAFAPLTDRSALLAALFSLGTIGIMAINDFKSMDGDRATGIRTLPVMYGATGASRIIVLIMAAAQLAVAAFNASWGNWWIAGIVAALLLAQIPLQRSFLKDPVGNAVKYSAGASGLFVVGMIVAAVGL